MTKPWSPSFMFFTIKGNITLRLSDLYNFSETGLRWQTIAMGTAEKIDKRFLVTFAPESKAVFWQNSMLLKGKPADSTVFLGGSAVSILKAFDQSSSTFCSRRAISHALHGSPDQAVNARPVAGGLILHQATARPALQAHNVKEEKDSGDLRLDLKT